MAPFTPFMSEELYMKLTGGKSVHLLNWPLSGGVNELVVNHMEQARQIINDGLSQRAKNSLKVRQPLSLATVKTSRPLGDEFTNIISEELNVKNIKYITTEGLELTNVEVELDLTLTAELKAEGLMREIIRNVQQTRKQAGLEVDDRILISIKSSDETITTVLSNKLLMDTIFEETLAIGLLDDDDTGLYKTKVKIDQIEVEIALKRK
jgi:isoleucyl-tRNA synthetase